mmetsp:Transcript_3201/g.2676  ORF Transcript_3201/g.2676 Transcript_3201/m.2676 type:complete len:121 (+) Transcript_3201:419-781(+)
MRRDIWFLKRVIEQGINLSIVDDYGNNCMNILFRNFWISVLKTMAVLNLIIDIFEDLKEVYLLVNHYNDSGMNCVLESAKFGDIDALGYMHYLNRRNGEILFDFGKRVEKTKESVFHLAA